jgi:hypothetical protein
LDGVPNRVRERWIVLTNLLPGIRDLRGPLAAGYVWLLAAWVVAEPRLRDTDPTGLWATIVHLDSAVSRVGVGVAVSVAAYLVGSLSEAGTSNFVRRVGRGVLILSKTTSAGYRSDGLGLKERLYGAVRGRYPERDGVKWFASAVPVISLRAARSLSLFVRRTLQPLLEATSEQTVRAALEAAGTSPGKARAEDLAEYLAKQIVRELSLIGTRLIGKEPELFSAYDRQRAEAEFRFSLVIPLTALTLVLGASNEWFLVALPFMLLIAWQGAVRLRVANSLLVDALVLGRVTSPSLEDLQARLKLGSALAADATIEDPATPQQAPAAPAVA